MHARQTTNSSKIVGLTQAAFVGKFRYSQTRSLCAHVPREGSRQLSILFAWQRSLDERPGSLQRRSFERQASDWIGHSPVTSHAFQALSPPKTRLFVSQLKMHPGGGFWISAQGFWLNELAGLGPRFSFDDAKNIRGSPQFALLSTRPLR